MQVYELDAGVTANLIGGDGDDGFSVGYDDPREPGLGLAFYLLSRLTTHSAFVIPAFLLAVPGLGLLIGAAVSYHLKKKWGLLERNPAAPAG